MTAFVKFRVVGESLLCLIISVACAPSRQNSTSVPNPGTSGSSVAGVSPSATSALVGAVTAQQVMAEIERRGGASVLEELVGSGDDVASERVWSGIRSGNKAWLDIAAALVPSADAGGAWDLSRALFDALEPAAEQVLVVSGNLLDQVCGNREIGAEDDHYEPAQVLEILDARIKSVSVVSSHDLEKRRERCLEFLRVSRTQIAMISGAPK